MYRQIGDRETDEPLAVVHEALVSCKDLAADAVDREAGVARPVAQYRLAKVNQALALVRRGIGTEPKAIDTMIGWAARKLSNLSPSHWLRWTRHFLKTLERQATEAEYCDFLEGLLADTEKELAGLQLRVSDPEKACAGRVRTYN